ncbi:6-carboxytetrahydropterin synthase QueD [Planococcus sp. CP5-4]|uniref:6-carboxytetrahydropterin synthase QueD n=1 Tax=unclassified Planococcus (in: firmicutes) TaxID=2662419 RepID=UPI001C2502BD|nr:MULTISPECIES: 6-carboxytetrahydropterin synthase QueD [unclassified Planococcus (in: firmicutes)]MBU9672999.1 6-carboxytetrahydropterin synthase QueD [Planococcus sp. CP5-4_YE]MBV0908771.1 6-carboxytetrahydropterin synthase QueD [Planococcus sp. CP5-4_UN]MBW6063540.1 6-carboxytetrahydropterin synthase QueD [Planococcus sp. CP5-4]
MMQQFYPAVPHPYCFELNKDMHFSAAHYIPADEAGKCAKMHGHTYHLNITIAGDQLNGTGFLVDFKHLKDLIHKRYDHSVLNDHPEFADTFPTTEQLAQQIHKLIQDMLDLSNNQPACVQVIVRETPTSYVVYRPKKVSS